MTLFEQILIALQIITESLPISSSGHVALLQMLYHRHSQLSQALYFLAHAPTLLICLFFFRDTWIPLATTVLTAGYYATPIIIFFATTTLLTLMGFLLQKRLALNTPLWIGFLITTCLLVLQAQAPYIAIINPLSFKYAVLLGITQAAVLMPGISRLAATICVARWLGYDMYTAFTISFLMLMPLMAGALIGTLIAKEARESLKAITKYDLLIIAASTIVAYLALHLTAYLAYSDKLWLLAFYMSIPVTIAWYKTRE